MSNVKTSGPKRGQIVDYLDAVYGKISCLVTAVNAANGTISITTFPPNVSPQTQTGVSYDANGTITGAWHYPEVEYF
jgi:hypothetical protein